MPRRESRAARADEILLLCLLKEFEDDNPGEVARKADIAEQFKPNTMNEEDALRLGWVDHERDEDDQADMATIVLTADGERILKSHFKTALATLERATLATKHAGQKQLMEALRSKILPYQSRYAGRGAQIAPDKLERLENAEENRKKTQQPLVPPKVDPPRRSNSGAGNRTGKAKPDKFKRPQRADARGRAGK